MKIVLGWGSKYIFLWIYYRWLSFSTMKVIHNPYFNITNTIIHSQFFFIHVIDFMNINSTLVVKFICLVNSHPCVLILGLWSMPFKKKFLIFSKALHAIHFIHEINCIYSVDLIQEHNFIHHQVTMYCSYGHSHCAKFH